MRSRMSPRGRSHARERGMALVAVVFMIVVLAAFAAFAMRVGAASEQDVATELLGERAMAAARSGLEFGLNRALTPPPAASCAAHPTTAINPSSFTLTQGSLNGFAVTVTFFCTDVVAGNYQSFNLVATATRGAYGSPDYVARTVTRFVSNAP
jgi:Tfp pilus assembly protein PilX